MDQLVPIFSVTQFFLKLYMISNRKMNETVYPDLIPSGRVLPNRRFLFTPASDQNKTHIGDARTKHQFVFIITDTDSNDNERVKQHLALGTHPALGIELFFQIGIK